LSFGEPVLLYFSDFATTQLAGGLMLTEQLSAVRRVNPLGQWQRGSAQ